MFSGSFLYSLDSKNRLSIPAKIRKNLLPESKDSFMITQGLGKCLDLYPLDEWQIIANRLKQLNQFDPNQRKFTRVFLQNAIDVEMDSQARIIIPQNLILLAGIEKEVFILGSLDKIELWNPKIYDEYISSSPDNYEQLAAKVMTGK
jgi:MraZ protein